MEQFRKTKNALLDKIQDARDKGQPSTELVEAIERIARGRVQKLGLTDLDDFVQEAIMHTLQKLHLIDLRKSPFSYITSMVWRKFLALARKEQNEKAKIDSYGQRKKDRGDDMSV